MEGLFETQSHCVVLGNRNTESLRCRRGPETQSHCAVGGELKTQTIERYRIVDKIPKKPYPFNKEDGILPGFGDTSNDLSK